MYSSGQFCCNSEIHLAKEKQVRTNEEVSLAYLNATLGSNTDPREFLVAMPFLTQITETRNVPNEFVQIVSSDGRNTLSVYYFYQLVLKQEPWREVMVDIVGGRWRRPLDAGEFFENLQRMSEENCKNELVGLFLKKLKSQGWFSVRLHEINILLE